MRWLRAVLILGLLATWLSAGNHCYLEMAGILPPDNCHTDSKPSSSQGDPCETGCKIVEKGGYKIQDETKVSIFVAVLLPAFFEPVVSDIVPNHSAEITAWPPETLHLPQFLVRTAIPIRGPSIVS